MVQGTVPMFDLEAQPMPTTGQAPTTTDINNNQTNILEQPPSYTSCNQNCLIEHTYTKF